MRVQLSHHDYNHLFLVGITSIWLSAKLVADDSNYVEMTVDDCVFYLENSFNIEDILSMERQMLKTLDYRVLLKEYIQPIE